MKTTKAIAQPNILPLRPEKNPLPARETRSFITVRLTNEHKSVLRRFARLRLKRHIRRVTVLDLFESYAEAQTNSRQVFYFQVLMPILDFEVTRLARVEKYLDPLHMHELVLDRSREIIEYRITRDGERDT